MFAAYRFYYHRINYHIIQYVEINGNNFTNNPTRISIYSEKLNNYYCRQLRVDKIKRTASTYASNGTRGPTRNGQVRLQPITGLPFLARQYIIILHRTRIKPVRFIQAAVIPGDRYGLKIVGVTKVVINTVKAVLPTHFFLS